MPACPAWGIPCGVFGPDLSAPDLKPLGQTQPYTHCPARPQDKTKTRPRPRQDQDKIKTRPRLRRPRPWPIQDSITVSLYTHQPNLHSNQTQNWIFKIQIIQEHVLRLGVQLVLCPVLSFPGPDWKGTQECSEMQTLIATILATKISNEVEKIDVEMSRHNRVNHVSCVLLVVAHCFCVLLVVAHFQPSFFTVALYRPRKCKTNVMHILSM